MDYRRFDLNLLVVLDALLEERGVNATARRLGMSQPNVSYALSKLRLQFKDELVVRVGNSMQLTVVGETLREPLRLILAGLETEILAERHFDPATSDRRFVISTSDIGELVFLPRLMAELSSHAPGITLQSRSISPEELQQAMANGSVDLALGYFPDLNGANFLTQKLFDHPFTCIARADHPVAAPDWSLDTFLSLGHIVVAQRGRSQELIEERLADLGLTRRVQLQSPHFISVPLLVANSDLISTLPAAVGAIFATMARLRLIAPPLCSPMISIQQFWHRRVHTDPGNAWLRKLITKLFRGRDPSAKS
ncbi:LysR family transcriptional regulator (plasmid) [Novosphingobium resinovorum]|uniref:LysR family transcriptional regulator n=1 Tax=Novosphingobium TaxID=165696 RepID=UPI001B3C9DB5|nr:MULTISPECIES: LysR family transcriptional regulator [Novosphingobium]MBF7015306.1 LysR family transcriptional regulator [Novosphingobium sp. HR1a]WJM29985.1 LysR family transcriptional regulator [Novosphingobium resinovorum]